MRFCPFCAAENVDEASHCAACARRLPSAVRKPTIAVAIPPAAGGDLKPAVAAAVVAPVAPVVPVAPVAMAKAAPVVAVAAETTKPAPAPDLKLPPSAELKRVATAPSEKPDTNPIIKEATQSVPPNGSPREATTSGYATQLVSVPGVEAVRPKLRPMPAVPDGGPFEAARYAIAFARARWQRRAAIASLTEEIKKETALLDSVLGELGKAGRAAKLELRVFAEENKAIDEAESRRNLTEQAIAELTAKKVEENARFEKIHHDLAARVSEREEDTKLADRDLTELDGKRRGLRDRRKEIERTQRTLMKAADELDEQSSRSGMGDMRQSLRRSSEEKRREAGKLNIEKEDLDGRLGGLEKPIGDATARHDLAKGELESARKDLDNAKEGHRHRIAELEAEQMRRTRELTQADAEIARRLVTLGTLVNLHRVEKPEFEPLYRRCDELRAAIGGQETEIERLTAERDAYDKASLIRGAVVVGVGFIVLITAIWVAIALLH